MLDVLSYYLHDFFDFFSSVTDLFFNFDWFAIPAIICICFAIIIALLRFFF